GCAVEVELQGEWSIVKPDDDGQKRVRYRAHPMKLPMLPREGDGQKLLASTFNDDVLHKIIQLARRSAPAPAPKVTREVKELDRRISNVFKVIDPGNTHGRRVQCISQALHEVLPQEQWDGTGVTEGQRAAVQDRFNVIYHERGYNGGLRD